MKAAPEKEKAMSRTRKIIEKARQIIDEGAISFDVDCCGGVWILVAILRDGRGFPIEGATGDKISIHEAAQTLNRRLGRA